MMVDTGSHCVAVCVYNIECQCVYIHEHIEKQCVYNIGANLLPVHLWLQSPVHSPQCMA